MTEKKLVVALAGNPNSGKTTIYNNLTGSRQHVGNYSGVTVEKKEGRVKHAGYDITVIDLPGTYGLSAYSPDELVSRNVILHARPDILVNIVDASNLERNLYLTSQLLELKIPMLLVLNMADVVEQRGDKIDSDLLSKLLGMSVVKAVGSKNEGTQEILTEVIKIAENKIELPERQVRYRREVEDELLVLQRIINQEKTAALEIAAGSDSVGNSRLPYPSRWLALKFLEKDREIMKHLEEFDQELPLQIEKSRKRLQSMIGDDAETCLVEDRYGFIRGVCREACQTNTLERLTLTEKIDNILLNRVLGIPVFLGIMWLLFQLTFTLGAPPMEWIESGIAALAGWVEVNMAESLLRSLLVDGIIGGVGGVLVFLPNILLLFLGIALLEGTGYMARAAFVMDNIMHRAGLHGKSFVPMLIGFGCTVPAMMATRTLENPRDRLVTMLVTPLMSCGARLPVYTLLIAAFFTPRAGGNVLFSLYLIGIILAIAMARLFRTYLLPGETEPFVMELPIYRMPTLKNILIHMWERTWLYLRKAGTIILAMSILMWGLFTFPNVDEHGRAFNEPAIQLENSYAGRMGKAIEPVIKPLGFDWKTGVALVSGLGAKEVVVSTMGTLYSIGDSEALAAEEAAAVKSFAEKVREQSGFTPLVAYVLMIFTLIYVPCLATVAIMKRETNGWKWPLFMVAYTLILAWLVSFIVYRGGLWLGIGV
ncbi:Ferrous iron transport protein B [Syntrophomonas zehnderi OL-4]|uniref:Ferrous iron transport protein B n=1 Tax=Syntrophomonas zehnderi OL-4 TaxID=690567 RepID=A0A0E4C7Z2_9FIRM|nr:ferrous iron transport protein B [Syntrophomonas zehnderi]CFX18126.1 Ferrous iron transport protein B [Syntrophomonas zehnderi OL-4]